MYQIDNATAAAVQPAPTAAGTAGFFTDGSAVGGVPATVVPAEWLNSVQMELINALAAAGITPSKALFNQLTSAIQTLPSSRLLNIQVFSTPGAFTYTPSAGVKSYQAEVVPGGGAGGGVAAAAAGQAAAGGGGGSGGRGISTRIANSGGSVPVTVGAGGVGVTGGAGGSGGTSSFGSFVSAPGGSGAVAQTSQAGPGFGQQGFGGSFPTGSAVMIAAPGWTGKPGVIYSSAVVFTGQGADTIYGQGGNSSGTSAVNLRLDGLNANGFGAGGSGGVATAGAAATKGGNGSSGIVLVYEYS